MPTSTGQITALQLSEPVVVAAPDQCLSGLFESQVARTPGAVAVVFGETRLTYGELNGEAERWAAVLRSRGVGPRVLVGLYLERSVELVVGLLAILKAGGAYVPLDPAYPAERLGWMIEDAALPVIVTQSSLVGSLPPHQAQLVCLDQPPPETRDPRPETRDPRPETRDPRPDDPAYVIYTSGSTGRPKGVVVPHRGVVRLVCGADYVNIRPEDVFLQAAPLAFDASTFELWGALLNGARLVMMPPGSPAPARIGEVIGREGVTILWLTSGLFNLMVNQQLNDLRPVKQLLVGGEALSVPHVQKALAALPDTRLINGYGPTENTTFTCCHRIRRDEDLRRGVPIGRPVRGTEVRVVDAQLREVPDGTTGELLASGSGLALGYLNRPELTAEKFVANPFGAGRAYRTGDQVRRRTDGVIEFIGRVDDQVKVRGFRIELGEIETVLCQHERVGEAVVVVREEAPGDQRLVAYVVPAAAGDPGEDGATLIPALREHLRRKLPEYMVAARYVVLAKLPLTPNGKVDRRALPAPDWGGGSGAGTYAAPRTPVEAALARIWSEVLRVERVGIHDNFFDLGGHSLLAMSAHAHIRRELGCEVPWNRFFEHPTVAHLAEQIERAPGPLGGGIPRRDAQAPAWPGFSQEQLWFFERLHPGTATYNVPDFWRVRGPLDVGALERALTELTRRQEALRTVFGEEAGRPVLVIRPAAPLRLAVEELRGDTVGERRAAAAAVAEAEAQRPFDLAAGPLFRARLLRVAADEHWLLLHAHHSITDGWSLSLQQRELSTLYQSFRAGQEPALPVPPVSFADYAAWQRARWAAGELAEQAAWWRGQLAGVPALRTLPADRPRPAVADHRGGQESRCLPPAVRAALQALGREEGATPFMVVAALTQVLLQRHTGETDIVIGTPAAGREQAELHGLIGFFVNMLVLRQTVEAGLPFRELLRQTRTTARAAYAHQDLPFEKLVEELAPARDAGSNPLFQVAVVYERAEDHGLTLAGTTAERLWPVTRTSKFDLLLTFREEAAGLRVCVDYRLDLYEPATIRRLLDHLEVLTAGALARPDRAVGSLPLLSAEERRQLEQWNATTAAAADRCVHELFLERAGRMPEKVAVVCGGRGLSYGELAAESGRWAEVLRSRGVGPGVLVGLYLERSVELVVGPVAILRAGGAYVPLDPAYPAERLGWMIEDAGMPVIVTQRSLVATLPPHGAEVVCLDEPPAETRDPKPETRNPRPDDPAYVIFTSGSTGRPKGVVVEHRNVVNVLRSICREPGFSESDTMLAVTTLSFDIAVAELFLPLTTGGRLVIAGREIAADGHRLRSLLETCGATFLQPTPVTWRLLLEAGWTGSPDLKMICTGEPLPPELAAQILPKGKILWNLYGPTETTIWSTGCRITDATEITIGRPVANTQVYIVNEALQLQPVGVPGELLIGGDGVARGYLNRPELTAEKFIPNPFGAGRVYRTGDLARWCPDGTIECLGRIDHQVKLRGYRIELGEIEAALARVQGVRQAVVAVRAEQLVGYVVPSPANGNGENEATLIPALRGHLRRSLPEYMVPARYVMLDQLPLTPNGKIDRKALPKPGPATEPAAAGGRYEGPRTETQRRLVTIWEQVLKRAPIGIHDNFFDLGGHSLLAVQLQARVREETGFALELRDLFQRGTVAALVEQVEAGTRQAEAPTAEWETGEL